MGLDLSDRTIVITGASRGLGKGLAEYFSRCGARLGLCARTQPQQEQDSVFAAPVDVTSLVEVEAFAEEVAKRLGTIDLWINNAGVLEPVKPVREVSSEEWRAHTDVNLLGVFHGCKAYLNHRHSSGKTGGVLVNISSGAAQSAYAGWGAYCAGKAAVDRLSEVIALEEMDIGLRVHSVAPGIIDTDMQTFIRGLSTANFPMVDKFVELKQADAFSSAEFVSERMAELVFGDETTEDVILRFPLEK